MHASSVGEGSVQRVLMSFINMHSIKLEKLFGVIALAGDVSAQDEAHFRKCS